MSTKIITKSELGKHTTKDDLWVAIHGKVYNVTSYREDHPGGIDVLLETAGTDGTEQFEDLGHSADAREVLERFLVGDLEKSDEDEAKPVKIERHLPTVETTSNPPHADHSVLGSHIGIAQLSILSGATLAACSLLTHHGNTATHNIFKTSNFSTSLLYLTPLAVTTSVLALGLMALHHRLMNLGPNFKNLPSHIRIVDPVVRPTAKNHAILDPRHAIELPVSSVENLSPNVKKFILTLPRPTDVVGLPIGQHISIKAAVGDKSVARSYTPTSSNKDRGRLELVIKMYEDGQFTGGYLDKVSVGDTMTVSGPRGQMRYRKGMADSIGMLAGGTGITPMFQIIRAICEDPTDKTKVNLIYCSAKEEDILLRKELDGFAKSNDNFNIHYILSHPPAGWTGGVGRADVNVVRKMFAPASPSSKAMICGPNGMVSAAKSWLTELGYDKARSVSKLDDQVFCF